MNFDDLVLTPLYQAFATVATLRLGQDQHSLRVIDQTAGVEVNSGPLTMPSIKPVAMCRYADVAALNMTPDQLIDAGLFVNGQYWTVKNVAPKPGAEGRASGEIMLILINGDL